MLRRLFARRKDLLMRHLFRTRDGDMSKSPALASVGPKAVKIPAATENVEPTRSEILLASVPKTARIFEIGPSFSPIAPKAEGWNTWSLDHTSREGLIAKYTGHQGVDVQRIEEVDFIWTGGPITEAVPSELHGTFDAFIASHVLEHTTDLIGFLDSAATLLKPTGTMIFAIPDKRYCFDYFQPLTTTGHVLRARTERRSRHTPCTAFENVAYVTKESHGIAWGQHPTRDLAFLHTLEQAKEWFSSMETRDEYADMHAWRFVPPSFELIILELARLGDTDWQVDRIGEAKGCEFFAWLRRGGKAAAAALEANELNARRMVLMKRSLLEIQTQIKWLLAGEPGLSSST
jgi:SAM-dependent methyltransferase